MKKFRPLALIAAIFLTATTASYAAYPDKPIRLVVPFSAGSNLDKLARVTGEGLSRQLGQTVVVDNVSGAGGTIGVDAVLAAPRDGYTLLFATMGTLVINPHIYKKLKHDPLKELKPVGLVGMSSNVLAVRPGLPFKTVAELIAYAKQNPGVLTYGSSGIGTSSHLTGAMLSSMAGIKLTHVPYRGSANAVADFLGGRLDLMLDAAQPYIPLVKAGKANVLARTSTRKFQGLPNWPSVAETGVTSFDVTAWNAIMVPDGMTSSDLEKLRTALQVVTKSTAFRDAITPDEPGDMSTEDFLTFLRQENAKWSKAVNDSGAAASQ